MVPDQPDTGPLLRELLKNRLMTVAGDQQVEQDRAQSILFMSMNRRDRGRPEGALLAGRDLLLEGHLGNAAARIAGCCLQRNDFLTPIIGSGSICQRQIQADEP